jgi:hypothetical protein
VTLWLPFAVIYIAGRVFTSGFTTKTSQPNQKTRRSEAIALFVKLISPILHLSRSTALVNPNRINPTLVQLYLADLSLPYVQTGNIIQLRALLHIFCHISNHLLTRMEDMPPCTRPISWGPQWRVSLIQQSGFSEKF